MVNVQLARSPRRTDEGAVLEIPCECGRSGCAEVIALPLCIYKQARRESRRLLLARGHELPDVGSPVSRYDSFVVAVSDR